MGVVIAALRSPQYDLRFSDLRNSRTYMTLALFERLKNATEEQKEWVVEL
jgi:hypothetical protein